MTVTPIRSTPPGRPDIDRLPPQSLDAEMAVLGSILVDSAMLDVAAEVLVDGDFYDPRNGAIWAAIVELERASKPIDKITLATELRDRGQLEMLGGLAYLSALMDAVPTAASAHYYATIVREKAALRGLIHAGTQISRLGYEGEDDAERAVDDAQTALNAATAAGAKSIALVTVHDVAERLLEQLESGQQPDVFGSPWPTLTATVGGFLPGELVMWAAGPKAGKSSALACLARYTADHHGPTVILAIEMGVEQTVRRLLALHSGISARRQRTGEVTGTDVTLLWDAVEAYRARPFHIVDRNVRSLAAIRRTLRAIHRREGKIAAVIVDHAGLITDGSSLSDKQSRNDRLEVMYQQLRAFGFEFGCTMHVVQHFNRPGMVGEPSVEWLRNIRGGGNPEGAADAIIFPYRANPGGAPPKDTRGIPIDDGLTPDQRKAQAKFIVGATRDGGSGSIEMRYVGHRNMWLERAQTRPWFETPNHDVTPTREDDDDDRDLAFDGWPT